MSTRNVLLLIFGTILVSVASALITVRLTQNKTDSSIRNTQSAQAQPVQIANGPIQIVPSKQPIPPPPPPPPTAPPPAVNKEGKLADLLSTLPPPSKDPIGDTRKPMSVNEVRTTLLKNAPSCHQEYEELCTKDLYLSEHPLACLRSKKEQISNACANQIAVIDEKFKKDCGSDIMRFCAVKTQRFPCLKEKYAELTPECKRNVLEYSRR